MNGSGGGALQAPGLAEIPGLVHGFFGRSDEDASHPAPNVDDATAPAARVLIPSAHAATRFAGLLWARMRQVHGTRVVSIVPTDPDAGAADGLLTGARGIVLPVVTADCVPILAVAPASGAIMALHAGWRGTLAGIVPAALALAERERGIEPRQWRMALGPAIGGCCYEIEVEIGRRFVGRWGAIENAWQGGRTHGRLDLRAVNRHVLIEHGVPHDQIASIGPCTACHSQAFHSYRRSGSAAGRQVSAIAWLAEPHRPPPA